MKIEEIFEKNDSEFLKFDRIKEKLSTRPDIHAFILLNKIDQGKSDIICSAEHDEIFLDVDLSTLEEKATEDQIIDLIRCGVRIGEYGICMFV